VNAVNRRGLLGLAGASLAGLVGTEEAMSSPEAVAPSRRKWAHTPSRQIIQERFFPNVPLVSQDGRKVRFYRDLLKDKIVMINMMYTRCEGICPGVTANLVKVQKLLGEKLGRDVFMYSISLKPQEDTPEALRGYMKAHRVGPGWAFYTGASNDIERLRFSMGFMDPDPQVDSDRLQHTGMIVYGNEKRELWAACPASGDPEWIVESVGFVMV